MLKTFILFLFTLAFGGTLAGNITWTACGPNNKEDVFYVDVEGCTGAGPCTIVAGQIYTVKFEACSVGLYEEIYSIPYTMTAYFPRTSTLTLPLPLPVPVGLPYPVQNGDLCQAFTPSSATQCCPARLPACGTFQIEIQAPLFILPIGNHVVTDGTLQFKVWYNSTFTPLLYCIQFPITYSFL